MSGGIYLIRDGEGLVKMDERAYESEDLLQGYLADHPDLLAGDQIDTAEPRRWLLVSREMSLASEEDGAGRCSVDHLFLDQDAIPTIVEVKRSTDTRIRREVVGQMLDYAANAVVYWPGETLRAQFETNHDAPEQDLAEFLDADADPEEFWRKVKTNLQAGRVRLIFVADEIPAELRRIVEFLNQQMDPAEVLAVEIKQYVSQNSNLKTLVSRVIGQTVEAQQKKSGATRSRSQWDEESFFQKWEEERSANEVRTGRKILEWSRGKGLQISWGRGANPSFSSKISYRGAEYTLLYVWSWTKNAFVEIEFVNLQALPPFDDESMRRELLHSLNETLGVEIPEDKIAKRPNIPLPILQKEEALGRFFGILEQVIEEIEVKNPNGTA